VLNNYSTATEVSFVNFQQCTQYHITVAAYTRVGSGETAELSVTTLSTNGT